MDEVWVSTLNVIRELTKAGFMINLAKCSFLSPEVDAVGYHICKEVYFAREKSLAKLLTVKLPTSYNQLMHVHG